MVRRCAVGCHLSLSALAALVLLLMMDLHRVDSVGEYLNWFVDLQTRVRIRISKMWQISCKNETDVLFVSLLLIVR